MFGMNIVNNILCETNRHSFQCFTAAGKDPDLFLRVTQEELLAYFGLCIAMSMHPLHNPLHDYWSQDWILRVPTLARVTTISRFKAITKYLHLNDNSKMLVR